MELLAETLALPFLEERSSLQLSTVGGDLWKEGDLCVVVHTVVEEMVVAVYWPVGFSNWSLCM